MIGPARPLSGAQTLSGGPFPWLLAYFRQAYRHKVDITADAGVHLIPLTGEHLLAEALHLAYSEDGIHWTALADNEPVLPVVPGKRRVRDPFLRRGFDGSFHLLAGFRRGLDYLHRLLAPLSGRPDRANFDRALLLSRPVPLPAKLCL